ncbi:MFS transporter [Parashewanella tropica]|uniref:MFS transporter n=1 Tax=Parashewanella tropica TaxID=2547970 RepID=UPI0010594E6F|nr:MFS transporter [Parashewanella tropica]
MDKELQAKSILGVTLFVTLLSVSGIALPYPVLAPLFNEGTSPLTHFMSLPKEILFGVVIGIYPLGVIIGSSVIGAYSDRYGRKKVLTLTMLGCSLSYMLTAIAAISGSFVLFALSRLLTGLFEGNIAIARAIAIDLHPTINKTKSLSWISAMGFGGYLIGPLAGGHLAPFGIDVLFLIAGLVCFIATLCCQLLLPNSTNQAVEQEDKGSSLVLLKDSSLRQFFILYLFLMLGINIYYEFYPLWLVEKFAYNPAQIGWATVLITSCMIFSSTMLNSRIEKRMTTAQAGLIGMLLVTTALFLVPVTSQQSYWITFALVGFGVGIYNGFLTSYISTAYEHKAQGQLMGMLVTIFCVGNLIAAGIGSVISLIQVSYSIWAAAFCIGAASLLFFRGHFKLSLWEK